MLKIHSFSKGFILLLLSVIFLPAGAFGQTAAVRDDLKKSLGKFDLVRLDNAAAMRGGDAGGKTLVIPAAAKTFTLEIVPRDLRAPRYRAEDETAAGLRSLEKDAVTTFKGKVAGDASSEVRLTINGETVAGFFVSGGERFFLEPASRFSRAAAPGETVVYRAEDFLHDRNFICHSDIAESIEDGKRMVEASASLNPNALRVIEMATEADFEFVNSVGSAAAANAKILSILNMVEGVYENQLNLTISVVYQHTWSTPDSFNGANSDTLLRSFQSYWNTNLPIAQYPRDAAHLFTYKPNVRSQGFAFLNVICNNPNFAYGLSGRVDPSWNWEEANFLITAHEIGHNLGANHNDTSSCSNTLMNAQLGGGTQLSFCSTSQTEIVSFVSSNGSCLTPRSTSAVRFDFDGDTKADVAVWRPQNGVWYISQSGGGFNFFAFGQAGDRPVAADYDGDGKTDAAVYRGGSWYIMRSATNTFQGVGFGLATDIPAPADFDGDGRADINVFRPATGNWYWLRSTNGSLGAAQFGTIGDMPVPADYDGDGRADINVFRPATGNWYRLNSGNGAFFAVQFGQAGDKPIAGDFDGDAKTDVAVWRPTDGGWYVLRSSNSSLFAQAFGLATDVPTPADFDGDGKTDVAVFRPADGNWYRFNSSNNSFAAVAFGLGTDIPAPSN